MEATTHRINDPLSDVTRKVRRNVIVTSTVALIMIYVNLLPSKIDSLGIKFDATHQAILLEIIFFTLLYLCISFLVYSISDFLKWKISLTDLVLKEEHATVENFIEEQRVRRSKSELTNASNIESLSDDEMEKFKLSEYKQKLKEELSARTKLYKGPVTIVSVIRAFIDFLAPVIIAIFALVQLKL
ncbi:hypothetical protein EXT46_04700 [Pseudoalteromonas sp. CO325X]|nr:hypothetical protein [Pseudoalteromonas sp. CO325X]RZF83596.1 hypothetical protein EXT46_04700 [Pseudoalteromonas sp. CO325X]